MSVDSYCRWLSGYFFVAGLDMDDLYQEARIAAWLAPGHERTAARRRILDLLKMSQRRPRLCVLHDRHAVPDPLEGRERLRLIVDAPRTDNERVAVGRALRGEPIGRHEKALQVALIRVRERLAA